MSARVILVLCLGMLVVASGCEARAATGTGSGRWGIDRRRFGALATHPRGNQGAGAVVGAGLGRSPERWLDPEWIRPKHETRLPSRPLSSMR